MTKDHEIADIVVYLKLPSVKRKTKTYCSTHETAGEPGAEPGRERGTGFCDSQPATPIVFADGSLKTHNLINPMLVVKTRTQIFHQIFGQMFDQILARILTRVLGEGKSHKHSVRYYLA